MNPAPCLYGVEIPRNTGDGFAACENHAMAFWQSRMTRAGERAEPIQLTDLTQLAKDIRRAASTACSPWFAAVAFPCSRLPAGWLTGTATDAGWIETGAKLNGTNLVARAASLAVYPYWPTGDEDGTTAYREAADATAGRSQPHGDSSDADARAGHDAAVDGQCSVRDGSDEACGPVDAAAPPGIALTLAHDPAAEAIGQVISVQGNVVRFELNAAGFDMLHNLLGE